MTRSGACSSAGSPSSRTECRGPGRRARILLSKPGRERREIPAFLIQPRFRALE
jgi:hypothetical protein